VTSGRLPQRAGLPGLNSGGSTAAVPRSLQWTNMLRSAGTNRSGANSPYGSFR